MTRQSTSSRREGPIWLRSVLILINLCLALGALWLGMSLPSYFRSVSPLVLEAAGEGSPTLLGRTEDALAAGRPGLAASLLEASKAISDKADLSDWQGRVEALVNEHPLYHWSGGPAPFYEQFLEGAPVLKEANTAVLPTLLPAENRRFLLGFLQQSPNRYVQDILRTRTLGSWDRFFPVFSTSGQPLDATILTLALLEQSSSLRGELRAALLASARAAMEEDLVARADLESIYLAVLTLGRYCNWLQLKTLMGGVDGVEALLFAARAVQDDPQKLPLLQSALLLGADPAELIPFLKRHDERGWESLIMALGYGEQAVEALLLFGRPAYSPPALWERLPAKLREGQQYFKNFAEAWPNLAMGMRAVSFAMCGFFLVAILRLLILGHRPKDPARRWLINLDSLVGGTLVMLLLWVLIEPGLLDFRPNEEGSLRLRVAQILPSSSSEVSNPVQTMFDQVTILILLLFFILQMLVFIFGLLKISEIRRQSVAPETKLHLLDNEENLFDLGLYVGLGGTVSSLILVVLNVVDASLMAAYASTLFGIIFVGLLKIGFLRPFRRQLILQRSA
jgi:hypothetical protein